MRRCENPFSNPASNQVDNVSMIGGKPKVSRLSMSAPTQTMGLDQIWAHREPRQHLLSTSSLVEAGSTSSLSTGGALSPDPLCVDPLSHDEGYEDSDDDSDHYDDDSSDNGIHIICICSSFYKLNILYIINYYFLVIHENKKVLLFYLLYFKFLLSMSFRLRLIAIDANNRIC